MAVVKRIAPGSAFKVGLAIYGIVGLLLGIFCLLIAVAGVSLAPQSALPFRGAAFGIAALILCPIIYGIIGGIVAAISALLYNLAAGWVGGLEVDLS